MVAKLKQAFQVHNPLKFAYIQEKIFCPTASLGTNYNLAFALDHFVFFLEKTLFTFIKNINM